MLKKAHRTRHTRRGLGEACSATLHVVGSIDPPPATTLASLFYPTAYPTKHHPKVGLVASEKMTLGSAATQFKAYELYQGKASLVVVGHADVRGSEKYNQALSERRAALVKEFLVSKGISTDKIQTRAEGKDQQIDNKAVEALENKNDEKPASWMTKHQKATWLAYNRRVDVILEPSGRESTKIYPLESADARILWQRPMPSLKQVEQASQISSSRFSRPAFGALAKLASKRHRRNECDSCVDQSKLAKNGKRDGSLASRPPLVGAEISVRYPVFLKVVCIIA